MRYLLMYIAFLNLLDALLTMYGLHYDYITESNPLMNHLYLTTPWLFLLVKVLLSLLLLLILSYLNPTKKASTMLKSVALVVCCFLHLHLFVTWLLDG
ncbi:DUF5658 family protein [Rossellomorea sp. AcN35-11]|nr:DUF5658 family protein [Rossellomorea sp. AcN35-11]